MSLAIDIVDGRGLSNDVHPELLLQDNAVLTVQFTVKGV